MEVQCMLKSGNGVRVAWIPEKNAVEGNVIKDKSSPNFGWVVKSVGQMRPQRASGSR